MLSSFATHAMSRFTLAFGHPSIVERWQFKLVVAAVAAAAILVIRLVL